MSTERLKSISVNSSTQKIKANFVGPLSVKDIIDERNCLLEDLEGRELNGIFNIKRLKRAYLRTGNGTASNIEQVRNAVELLDAQRAKEENPEKVGATSLMCLGDGTTPPQELCETARGIAETRTTHKRVNLASYVGNNGQSTIALQRKRKEKQNLRERNKEQNMPTQDEEMDIAKAKLKHGLLFVLLASKRKRKIKNGHEENYNIWVPMDTLREILIHELKVDPVIGRDGLPTGRITIKIYNPEKQEYQQLGENKAIQVTGSALKFARQWYSNVPLKNRKKRHKRTKVRFNPNTIIYEN